MADESFASWYRDQHRRVVSALVVATGDVDAATDAAHEAFARCLRRWEGGDRPADPAAWTYRVALNHLRRTWRRRRRERDLAEGLLRPAATVDLPEPAVELWAAVAELPERMRLAVVLRYVGGLTEAQVAEAMDVAPGTVAATLSKARRRLAAALAPRPEEQIR